MKFKNTKIKDLFIINPEPNYDNRGYFGRIFCKNEIKEINFRGEIVQINQSLTKVKGTIRGLHFQFSPFKEVKIIKCLKGKVFDVAIDLRKDSVTFLNWHGEILSSENMKMMFIPEGFAHGFQTLEENCELLYLHSEFYNKNYESGIKYNDPILGIEWPLIMMELSTRDSELPYLDENFKGM